MHISRTVMLASLVLLVVTGFFLGRYPAGKPNWRPRCMESGLIALETATSPAEVNEIWGQCDLKKANLTPCLEVCFGFMIAYGLLFVLLALVAKQRGQGWVRWAGMIAIFTAI